MLTVVVLTVLWLIVVVPMIVRRGDEKARDRSVEGFGRAMRALTRRPVDRPADPDDATFVMPRVVEPRAEVFVPGSAQPDSDLALATRRPVPAAEEALMYPVDRTEMSAARRAMLARRRRSLAVLGVGSAVTVLLAIFMGGITWLLALAFLAGLGGYLAFLRQQAVRDRERRASRQLRSVSRRPRDHDLTAASSASADPVAVAEPSSVVRIDDDDVQLHMLDTVDLTGLYDEKADELAPVRRRAG